MTANSIPIQIPTVRFAAGDSIAMKSVTQTIICRWSREYASRENEIDQMLRAGLFVDLYAIIRHGIRASVESYSIKKLEPLYGFERAAALADASRTLAKIQACLELDDLDGIEEKDRAIARAYNRGKEI